jgi:hypothetical protein
MALYEADIAMEQDTTEELPQTPPVPTPTATDTTETATETTPDDKNTYHHRKLEREAYADASAMRMPADLLSPSELIEIGFNAQILTNDEAIKLDIFRTSNPTLIEALCQVMIGHSGEEFYRNVMTYDIVTSAHLNGREVSLPAIFWCIVTSYCLQYNICQTLYTISKEEFVKIYVPLMNLHNTKG